MQLDGQLHLAGLPRADDVARAGLVVLAGLAGEPEVARAAATGLPVIAFDGIQGADLRGDVCVALPFAPDGGHVRLEAAPERAAELVVAALYSGATTRAELLAALRELGRFDEHGDPVDPPVWLWRAAPDWRLSPLRSV